jgi:hypothetical protein
VRRPLVDSLDRKSFWRIAAAAALATVIWLAAHYSSAWLAAVVSFALLTILSTLISTKVPAVVERVSGSEPLNVAVGADIGFYSDGWAVVLPDDVDSRSTPAEGLDDHLRARKHLFESGAFDLRDSHLLLTLEGRSVDSVRVTGLYSRVSRRQAPLSGAVVGSPSAGEQEIVAAHFDLEQDEAPARTDDGREYFDNYVLTLGRGESFTYRIVARVEHSACEWELVLSYSHRGTEYELAVDNAGQPFRTAARSERVASSYEWAWYEQPPRLVRQPSN